MFGFIRIPQDPVRNVASQAFHDEAVMLYQHLIYQFGIDILFGCPIVQGLRQLLFALRPCVADDAQAEPALQFSDKRQAIFWVKERPTSYKDQDQNECIDHLLELSISICVNQSKGLLPANSTGDRLDSLCYFRLREIFTEGALK